MVGVAELVTVALIDNERDGDNVQVTVAELLQLWLRVQECDQLLERVADCVREKEPVVDPDGVVV